MKHHDSLYQFIWLTRPLLQQIQTSVEQDLAQTPLTTAMRAVLEILHTNGPQTVPALAKSLEIQRQYVQVMVNETLTHHFTEKRQNPAHKRSALIALTQRGETEITKIRSAEMEKIAAIAQDLSPQDIETALRVSKFCHAAFQNLNAKAHK